MFGQNMVPPDALGWNNNWNQKDASEIKQEPVVEQKAECEPDEEMGSEMEWDSDIEHSDDECEFCVDSTEIKRELKEEIFDEKSEQETLNEEEIGLAFQNDSNQGELKDDWSSYESENEFRVFMDYMQTCPPEIAYDLHCALWKQWEFQLLNYNNKFYWQTLHSSKGVATPKQTPETDTNSYKKESTVPKDLKWKKYKCNQCNFAVAQRSDLKRHMVSHSSVKPFKCNQCDFTSAYANNLKRHTLTHTGEKPLKCNQCDYASAVRSGLKSHMRKHTREKPFKCSQCDFACAFGHDLKRHISKHTGEKSFQYDCCSKKFCQKNHFLSDDHPSGAKKQDIRGATTLWRPF